MDEQTFVLEFDGMEIVVAGMTAEQQVDLECEIVAIQYTEFCSGRPEYSVTWAQY